ncbi:ABC transporter permease [Marinobacter subterrani]|uniref:ABC-type transport system involved in multi-copper enzyme maturation, permease component n=1 Tax=Marinobacter subterrani TaxID=1658765 RepID=A0A0J7JDF3_9GAMM|nr:ABC transporter permease subunit [Marinobacter subterrani]KMQ76117.1 ABC-type transport system involved in multi-copper enzyme maturation, permease component [Marinobacter subterrani]
MNSIWTIARKELSDSLRNRWLVAISLVFATLALGIAWFGAAASGQVGYASTPATIASLASLGIFLIPLIALLLAYDAIVGEEEGGTLLLLMTYPLSRSQLLLGKFLGHGLTLALATLIGFGVAGVAIAMLVEDVAIASLAVAMARFIVSTVLLGWGFIALAYMVSVRVSEKPIAAGLALAIWFFFVLIFDLLLLGTLVASEGKFSAGLLPWLLMLNPTDIYRLLNIVAFDGAAQLSGVLSLGADLPIGAFGLWVGLVLWCVIPLVGALLLFRNRRI